MSPFPWKHSALSVSPSQSFPLFLFLSFCPLSFSPPLLSFPLTRSGISLCFLSLSPSAFISLLSPSSAISLSRRTDGRDRQMDHLVPTLHQYYLTTSFLFPFLPLFLPSPPPSFVCSCGFPRCGLINTSVGKPNPAEEWL